MTFRFLAAMLGVGAILGAASGALAQSGSCCLQTGACIITTTQLDCASPTNKGTFVGNAACTQGLLGDCYPDVFVLSISDAQHFASAPSGGKTIHAFALGTYSCNQGTSPVAWQSTTPAHPVIAQDLFRLNNGRFEHIGMAWLKHGYFALSLVVPSCGPCAYGIPSGLALGVGCSDPYSAAGENGTQSRMGPRSIVNPSTGVFPYDDTTWPPLDGTQIARRLQVDETDLNNPGATYWAQGQYITADDAQAGRGYNNASYRGVLFGAAPNFVPTMLATTVTKTPVIYAWAANGLGLSVADPDVQTSFVDVPGDGRIYVASKATNLGGGTWHYEYAVQNLNSDRAGGGFSVAIPAGATATNLGFHAPLYHSGEVYDNTPWIGTAGTNSVHWDPSPLPNPNPLNLQTNALRFCTLYNFRFDANVAPKTLGQITLPLFKPGTPAAVTVGAVVPTVCRADFDGVGGVQVADIFAFLSAWFAHNSRADFNGDGSITVADIFAFLTAWFGGC